MIMFVGCQAVTQGTPCMRQLPLAFAIFSLVLLFGCTGDNDTLQVDFEKTINVARPETDSGNRRRLKVAVAAMVSPKETFVYYREILQYLSEKLNREVQLVQRKTYGEINELLGKGEIDLAFLCSGPYAAEKDKHGFELLATPEINGSHFYQAYLIVNEKSEFNDLEDLRGKTFAFTDPDSNTGRLVPTFWLQERGETPETFFSQTIFTYSHDNSIMAVAKGMVDGAAVDGLIWEYFNATNPVVTSQTRIIRKSDLYGIPPLVASSALSTADKESTRKILFSAHEDPKGRQILDGLKIDRFIEPRDEWYDSIRAMIKGLHLHARQPDDHAKP